MNSSEIVVIGSSWGGLHAVGEILRGLPGDFPLPVVLVQHRSESGEDLLAGLLTRRGALDVREAEDKEALCRGCVFVAPRGYHLLVERDHLELSTEAAVRHSRPSIDLALESAADAYGPGVIGVILTGANDDGAAGLAAVRRRGGMTIVQDPATAEVPTMPAAALAAADPQAVVDVGEIAPLLVSLAQAVSR
jgi:two-component system chemotaxis response regulator CheB